MPIYEYACDACGHRFEKLMRISADPPACPECEAGPARKLVSASGFILKGGGWYKDHYGLKSSGGSAASGGEGTSSGMDSGSSGGGSGGSGGSGGDTAGSSSSEAS